MSLREMLTNKLSTCKIPVYPISISIQIQIDSLIFNLFQKKILLFKTDERLFQILLLQMDTCTGKYLKKIMQTEKSFLFAKR